MDICTKSLRAIIAAIGMMLISYGALAENPDTDGSDFLAWQRVNMTLGCDKTPDGLKIGILDEVTRTRMRKKRGLDIKLGDPCLATLAMFPRSHTKFATFSGGASHPPSDTIDECLIWILTGPNVSEKVTVRGFDALKKASIVACDVTEEGGLETVFVDGGGGYTPQPGESCGVTRGALGGNAYPAKWRGPSRKKWTGPISATLGYITGIPVGGLMWVGTAHGEVEVLECNLNEEGDGLVVTHRENAEGVDTASLGEPCLDMLAARQEETRSMRFTGPFPIPQGQSDGVEDSYIFVSDPGVGILAPG